MATVSDMFDFLPIHPRILLIIGVIDFWAGRNTHASKGLERRKRYTSALLGWYHWFWLGFLSVTSHTLVGRYSHMFLAMFHFYFFFFFSLMSLWIFSSLSCKLIESRSHGGAHCTAAIDQLAKIVSGWKPLTCRTYLSRKKKSLAPLLCLGRCCTSYTSLPMLPLLVWMLLLS